jgi:phosphoglycerate dehydrogenase-like enzyme
MKPKVLISDALSQKAVDIFKERGVDVDLKVGIKADELKSIIGQYDGLAIRSATKVIPEIISAATNLKVVGRAGIGVDNVDVPAATSRGIVVMNTPFGNSITTGEHAIALMFALARQLPARVARDDHARSLLVSSRCRSCGRDFRRPAPQMRRFDRARRSYSSPCGEPR